MAVDPRDQIWNVTFETFYDVYFEEMMSDALIERWQWLDEGTKVVVALTATGSAVAGWALWNDPNYKWIWTVFASVSAILSIIHSALGVPGRLKGHGDNRRIFAALRIDLETFRQRMQINSEFPVDEFTSEFTKFRQRFGSAIQSVRDDILITKCLRVNTQDQLDERLGDKVVQTL